MTTEKMLKSVKFKCSCYWQGCVDRVFKVCVESGFKCSEVTVAIFCPIYRSAELVNDAHAHSLSASRGWSR